MLFVKRVPCALYKAHKEHHTEENIVGNHASPCRYKTEAKHLCAYECEADSDEPHTDDIECKRHFGVAHALHHTFDNDGESIEGFGNGNHAQNRAAQTYYFVIIGEDIH